MLKPTPGWVAYRNLTSNKVHLVNIGKISKTACGKRFQWDRYEKYRVKLFKEEDLCGLCAKNLTAYEDAPAPVCANPTVPTVPRDTFRPCPPIPSEAAQPSGISRSEALKAQELLIDYVTQKKGAKSLTTHLLRWGMDWEVLVKNPQVPQGLPFHGQIPGVTPGAPIPPPVNTEAEKWKGQLASSHQARERLATAIANERKELEKLRYGHDQHELICYTLKAEPGPNKPGDTAYEYVCSLVGDNEQLKGKVQKVTAIATEKYKQLGGKYSALEEAYEKVAGRLTGLRKATAGHTVETVEAIMKHVPPSGLSDGLMLKIESVPTPVGTDATVTYSVVPIHKEPELVYCLQTTGEWHMYCHPCEEPATLLPHKQKHQGIEYDRILDKSGQIWIGHWNDGLKEEGK